MLKRFLSSALALSLVFGGAAMLPEGAVELGSQISASAGVLNDKEASGYYYKELDNGTVEITGVNYSKIKMDTKKIVIPSKLAGKKVTSLGLYALTGGLRFETVTIPASIEKVDIGSFGASDICKNVYIDGESNKFVSVDGVLYTKDKKTLVYVPSGRDSFTIPKTVKKIAAGAIYWNYNIKSLTIPNSVTSIGDLAFYACNFESITLSKNLKSIGEAAFGRCTGLKIIKIPEGVTSIEKNTFDCANSLETITLPSTLKEIKNYAFAGCISLKSVIIPVNVKSIGERAFVSCDKLTKMTVYGNVKTVGDQFVGYYYSYEGDQLNNYVLNKNLSIYCQKGSAIEKYAKDNGIKYSYIKTTDIKSATISGIKNRHYTGKALTQSPVVKVGGKTLKAGTDYTLSYKNNTKIGTATVTIKGKGKYSGSVSKTFKVCPPKTTLKSASSPAKGKLKVKYTKEKNATAYQITYSTSSSFAKSKTASKSSTKLTKTISGLKSGKTYYVKVRTYKTVSGKRIYSGYSAVKKVKVK